MLHLLPAVAESGVIDLPATSYRHGGGRKQAESVGSAIGTKPNSTSGSIILLAFCSELWASFGSFYCVYFVEAKHLRVIKSQVKVLIRFFFGT